MACGLSEGRFLVRSGSVEIVRCRRFFGGLRCVVCVCEMT